MATVTYIPEHKQTLGAMKAVMEYCMQQKKTVDAETGAQFVSGVNCIGANSVTEFLATKAAFGKMGGTRFYQYVQSFSPKESISHAQAHKIALEFAARAWNGYEVLVCTHCDTAHIHSHFVINSVSWENGKKLRQNPNTLNELRKLSDEICASYGLSIVRPKEKQSREMSAREYRSAVRGESWKLQLEIVIDQAMELAKSREHFIRLMKWEGYGVRWTADRKYITYTTPEGYKCRDKKLHEEKYRKENLELEFRIRKKILAGNEGNAERNAAPCQTSAARCRADGSELERDDFVTAGAGGDAVADYGTSKYAGRPRAVCRLGERDTDNFSGRAGGTEQAVGAASAGADRSSEQTDRTVAEGGDGNGETGWEHERDVFIRSLGGVDTDSQNASQAVLDFSDSQFDFGNLGVDAAYLAADLSEIMEGKPVEDSTTMCPIHERKRNQELSM